MIRSRLFVFALALSLVFLFSTGALAQSIDRAQLEREIESLRTQLEAKEKLFPAIGPSLLNSFNNRIRVSTVCFPEKITTASYWCVVVGHIIHLYG